MDYLILIVGLALLTIGADWLTKGCVGMAARFRVPEFVVGLTVMAVGTSMPELTVSAMSALNGSGDMAIGNVTGSNIFNILLILGVCGSIKPLTMGGITPLDIWMVVAVAVVLLISALVIGVRRITRAEGVLYLAIYVGYVVMLLR